MTPRRWYVIATMMMLAVVPTLAGANKVLNGDFETAGDDTCDIPDWTDDHADEGRLCRTHRVDAIGADNSAGLLIVGPEVRRVSELFAVSAGETLDFTLDAQVVLGASVGVLELVDVDGRTICGAKIGTLGEVDNVIPEIGFTHYETSVVVCPGAVSGRVLLGGSYLIDPLAIISLPVGATVFDNIFVDTAA